MALEPLRWLPILPPYSSNSCNSLWRVFCILLKFLDMWGHVDLGCFMKKFRSRCAFRSRRAWRSGTTHSALHSKTMQTSPHGAPALRRL